MWEITYPPDRPFTADVPSNAVKVFAAIGEESPAGGAESVAKKVGPFVYSSYANPTRKEMGYTDPDPDAMRLRNRARRGSAYEGVGLYAANPCPWQPRQYMAEFKALGLSESEVEKFFDVFVDIDKDVSGEASFGEMFGYLEIPQSRFASRVLRAFDLDRSGKIDFCEFVVSLWNLCTARHGQLAHFTWDLYVDESQCGVPDCLGPYELRQMVKELHSKDYDTANPLKPFELLLWKELNAFLGTELYSSMDSRRDGLPNVTRERFANFASSHSALLYPCFRIQTYLQRVCLGELFWERVGAQSQKAGIKPSPFRSADIAKLKETLGARQRRASTIAEQEALAREDQVVQLVGGHARAAAGAADRDFSAGDKQASDGGAYDELDEDEGDSDSSGGTTDDETVAEQEAALLQVSRARDQSTTVSPSPTMLMRDLLHSRQDRQQRHRQHRAKRAAQQRNAEAVARANRLIVEKMDQGAMEAGTKAKHRTAKRAAAFAVPADISAGTDDAAAAHDDPDNPFRNQRAVIDDRKIHGGALPPPTAKASKGGGHAASAEAAFPEGGYCRVGALVDPYDVAAKQDKANWSQPTRRLVLSSTGREAATSRKYQRRFKPPPSMVKTAPYDDAAAVPSSSGPRGSSGRQPRTDVDPYGTYTAQQEKNKLWSGGGRGSVRLDKQRGRTDNSARAVTAPGAEVGTANGGGAFATQLPAVDWARENGSGIVFAAGAPAPPENVVAADIGGRSVRIEFEEAQSHGASVAAYKAEVVREPDDWCGRWESASSTDSDSGSSSAEDSNSGGVSVSSHGSSSDDGSRHAGITLVCLEHSRTGITGAAPVADDPNCTTKRIVRTGSVPPRVGERRRRWRRAMPPPHRFEQRQVIEAEAILEPVRPAPGEKFLFAQRGLKHSTWYTIRIAAYNRVGWGPWTSEMTFRTLAEVPGPPALRLAEGSMIFDALTRSQLLPPLERPFSNRVLSRTEHRVSDISRYCEGPYRYGIIRDAAEEGLDPVADVVVHENQGGSMAAQFDIAGTAANGSPIIEYELHTLHGSTLLSVEVLGARGGDSSGPFEAAVKMQPHHDHRVHYLKRGLKPFEEFTFRARAKNARGYGPFSPPVTVTTPPGPPDPPDRSKVHSLPCGKGLLARWLPPSCNGAPLLGYRIETTNLSGRTWHGGLHGVLLESAHGAEDANASHWWVHVPAQARPQFEQQRLDNNVMYTVRIAALNRYGWSEWSAPVTARTLTLPPIAPDPPTASLTTSNSVVVNWTSPDGRGAPVVQFMLRVEGRSACPCKACRVGSPVFREIELSSSRGANSYEWRFLQPNTLFKFSVMARNVRGWSDPSPSLDAWTKSAVPDSPEQLLVGTNMQAQLRLGQPAVGTRSLQLLWNRPASHGPAIERYQLQQGDSHAHKWLTQAFYNSTPPMNGSRRKRTNHTMQHMWIPAAALRFGSGGGDPETLALEGPLAPRTMSHTQHRLPADALVSFRVRARNHLGWGPWSKPLKVPTPSAMPLRLTPWDSRLPVAWARQNREKERWDAAEVEALQRARSDVGGSVKDKTFGGRIGRSALRVSKRWDAFTKQRRFHCQAHFGRREALFLDSQAGREYAPEAERALAWLRRGRDTQEEQLDAEYMKAIEAPIVPALRWHRKCRASRSLGKIAHSPTVGTLPNSNYLARAGARAARRAADDREMARRRKLLRARLAKEAAARRRGLLLFDGPVRWVIEVLDNGEVDDEHEDDDGEEEAEPGAAALRAQRWCRALPNSRSIMQRHTRIARREQVAQEQNETRKQLSTGGEWCKGRAAHYSAKTDTIFIEGFGVSSDGNITDAALSLLRGEVKVDFSYMRFRKSLDVSESEQALVFEMLQRRCNWCLQQAEQDEQDELAARRALASAAGARR